MLGWGTDQFEPKADIQKIIIGLVFVIAIPLLLANATGVDIIKGCVTGPVLDDDGVETTDTDGNVITDCKQASKGVDEGFVKTILLDVDEYLPLGIRLLILAMVAAIFIGPGIKVIKHELGCTRHI